MKPYPDGQNHFVLNASLLNFSNHTLKFPSLPGRLRFNGNGDGLSFSTLQSCDGKQCLSVSAVTSCSQSNITKMLLTLPTPKRDQKLSLVIWRKKKPSFVQNVFRPLKKTKKKIKKSKPCPPTRWYKWKKQGLSFLWNKTHTDRHQTKLHTQYYYIFKVFVFDDDSVHWLTDQLLSISQSFPQMLTSIHRPDAAKSWLQMSVCHEGLILHLTLILMSLMMGGWKLMWIIGWDAILIFKGRGRSSVA